MDRVRIHRQKLAELREIVENVGKNPGSINDTDFRRRMSEVKESVNVLLNDAREAVGKLFYMEDKQASHEGFWHSCHYMEIHWNNIHMTQSRINYVSEQQIETIVLWQIIVSTITRSVNFAFALE